MKLGMSTLWTEEPTTRVGDRTRLFAAHLSQAAELTREERPTVVPASTRKRRTTKAPRSSARPAPSA